MDRVTGSKINRFRRTIFDFRETIFDRLQCGEKSEQRARRRRLNDQLVPVPAHERVLPGKLEFPGDADRLVGTVPEEFDMAWAWVVQAARTNPWRLSAAPGFSAWTMTRPW
jgi:hypothetical protein